MPADASAYAALGLKPGADWAAIERAYKKLIKRHHPDRKGGDGKRAAEIIHAYRELRRDRPSKGQLVLHEDIDELRSALGGNGWAYAALATAVGVICLILATGPIASLVDRLSGLTMPASVRMEQVTRADPMDRPLTASAIDTAIIEALRIDRASDEMALATRSRDCHRQLRLKPTLAQLDRCLAFDDAVVVLQDRDPLRDQGPFSELDVTGRQMSAATLLSNDSIAIDGRLDRIRLAVELALAPAAPQQPEANAASAD